MESPFSVHERVRHHIQKLREAGLDTQHFFDALIGLRDDRALTRPHREALYKLIAMESFIWYLEALRNEPIDRQKLAEDMNARAQELAEASQAVPTPPASPAPRKKPTPRKK